jgi:hypothetical protein
MSPELKNFTEAIRSNYDSVIDRIDQAARSVSREPSNIRLVVVTKGQPIEKVQAVIAAGAMHLGENYVEDAIPKIKSIDQEYLSWHMIGHVQSKKARLVCENFDWLHSLDSVKLAIRLNNFLEESVKKLPVLLEMNVSGEESKFGFPAWIEGQWMDLVDQVSQLTRLPNIEICGLMTMAPFSDNPGDSRPYFKRLREIQQLLARKFPQVDWSELSMGMSSDFEVAIQEGATIVRVGEAILGKRPA